MKSSSIEPRSIVVGLGWALQAHDMVTLFACPKGVQRSGLPRNALQLFPAFLRARLMGNLWDRLSDIPKMDKLCCNIFCGNPPVLILEYLGVVRQEKSEKYFIWHELLPPNVFFWLPNGGGGVRMPQFAERNSWRGGVTFETFQFFALPLPP